MFTARFELDEEPIPLGCDAVSLGNRPFKMKALSSKNRKLVTSVGMSRNDGVSTTPSRDILSNWHHIPATVSAPNTPSLYITLTALQSVPVSNSLRINPSQLKAD